MANYISGTNEIPTTKELAAHLKLTPTRIRQLRNGGIFRYAVDSEGNSLTGRWHLQECVEAYEDYKRISAIKTQEAGSWVYFLRSGSLLKIGYASNIGDRVNTYVSYNPQIEFLGTIPGTRIDERNLHEKFSRYGLRIPGTREWFHFGGELRDFVEKLFIEIPEESLFSRLSRGDTDKLGRSKTFHPSLARVLDRVSELWRPKKSDIDNNNDGDEARARGLATLSTT